MLALAVLTAAVAGACPQNLANGIETPPGARQLVTVEAKVAKTTHAELRTWRRTGDCWVAAAGPVRRPARPQRALGEPERGRRHDADGPLRDRPHDVRQRAEPRRPFRLPAPPLRRLVGRGSLVADLQLLPARPVRHAAALRRRERGHVAAASPVSLPRGDRVQHAPRRARPRLGHLPARADRRADDRLCQPAARRAASCAPLAAPGRAADDCDRHDPGSCARRVTFPTFLPCPTTSPSCRRGCARSGRR